ncbi:hypothetical protein PENARI_c106G12408 [Penicillium arizonense]|uniref:Xylanolytic transcriptional activator regulatory domain-containing protein n=1 Tax=Penicillium arizonense TaxID=1835702 RepID=A0A1F5L1E2_PENAI|nr:hypothetical protein PENARI_c106G12408 [Penicillium arizonense]OGE46810.1 hypothetical protein PENARI_c106G12408 [Penicillium arizonense]
MSQTPRKPQRVSKAYSTELTLLLQATSATDAVLNVAKVKIRYAGTRAPVRDTQFVTTPVSEHFTPVAASTPTTRTTLGSPPSMSPYYPGSARTQALDGDPWSAFNTSGVVTEGYDDDVALRHSWSSFAISSNRQIQDLVQVYFEIVYPIFPLFHKQSFIGKVQNQEYLRNPGLFASTMAVCALVSGRVRDGALFTNRWRRDQLAEPPSEIFYAVAKDTIPRDLSRANGMNYMRACAILAIASIQNGQIKNIRKYSGMYHTLTSMEGLHDEDLWPKDLSIIETEERRRLFWSMYTLDIYSTIMWGGVIRYREANSLVRYPSEVDDEFIIYHDYGLPPVSPYSSVLSSGDVTIASPQPVAWLRGWNFTTDLYRILEHVVDSNWRRFSAANGTAQVHSLFSPPPISEAAVMEHILSMYAALPSQFKETPPITGDMTKDLFGFQSANIQATLQLLRMSILSAEELGVDRKCDVAEELLSFFSKVPLGYLRAISSPLLHHLGSIGYILGSVMEGSLSEASYQRVRTLLVDIAALLHLLETSLQRATGASERLWSQLDRIDAYMHASRQLNLTAGHPPTNNNSVPVDAGTWPTTLSTANSHSGSGPAVGAPTALSEQTLQFQLPPELLTDWPWPLDAAHSEGFLPLAFE